MSARAHRDRPRQPDGGPAEPDASTAARASDRRLLTRVVLRNYKSIGACDVAPAQLSFLVGPNGSGKSNFLDALRFVSDSLRFSLDHALRDRGGIQEVRRRSGGHPTHFGIRLEIRLPTGQGHYAFEVAARPNGGYSIQKERCEFVDQAGAWKRHAYTVDNGEVGDRTFDPAPAAASDRLYLVSVSGLPAFRPLFDALSDMGFYNLNPDALRDLQSPDPGKLLRRDGSNLASVLANLESQSPDRKARIEEYLAKVVPGIEEPEIALHPAAAGILTDALRDASEQTQILVTSHSPDLLDNETIPDEAILAVLSEHGETRIGPLDESGRSVLRDHLFTAGELLRMDQLRPDLTKARDRSASSDKLWRDVEVLLTECAGEEGR
jgi:predicted ATPase